MTELKIVEGTLVGKKYKPGISYDFKLAIPIVGDYDYAVWIEHDGQNDANVNAMLRLADEGKAPYSVNIGVMPGQLQMPNGTKREMRMNNYDLFDREYGDFVVYELIPYIAKTYSIRFSDSPDRHLVSGGSSGGVSAFVIAWFHSDYFHRVYMSSPSFLAMGRCNEIPYLIRKYETKPLRIYEESSENEVDDYFGWSKPIDEESGDGLEFAGYDYKFVYFPGEKHCSRYRDENEAYIRGEWLWRGWQTETVTAPRNSARVDKVVPSNGRWERCSDFPKTDAMPSPAVLADGFDRVVLSNDEQAFYAASQTDDVIYMFLNDGAVSKEKRILHAMLHTLPQYHPKGAIDMAVDKADRLFVLTSIGIQCVRSYGLVDVILDLPDAAKPQRIAVTDALYVETEQGIYKRPLTETCTVGDGTPRKHISYYD